ncbi:hypothetical protein D3C85_1450940 [compost metagenome]
MYDTKWPCSHPQPLRLCLAAEVHIIEMELELLIETHTSLHQPFTVSSQQQPVQQLARLRSRPEIRDRARETAAMPYRAAQEAFFIPGKPIVDKCPRWLTFDATRVTCKPDDIEGFNPFP